MKSNLKKSFCTLAAFIVGASVFGAPSFDVDRAVVVKYAKPSNGTQDQWGPLNCHDPKIFQDDDGTYYVYSTDASIGGAGEKGLQIRKSKDLINWESQPRSAIQNQWDRDWVKWVFYKQAYKSSWAPTVIKQNGLYYMYHGIITDGRNPGYPDASITFAIASSPLGPFYPAAKAAKKDPKIKEVLDSLGVSYKQSTLVRYCYEDRSMSIDADEALSMETLYNTGYYDTNNEESGDFASLAYGFGCIDPEFVMDVATGKLMEYTIGGRKCYAVTYGSWKGGIALMYVDAVSLKAVDREGNELDVPADTVEGAFGKCIGGGYGAAYEGAQVIFNKDTGYYYLFVSMGNLDYEYRVGVGRSKSIEGPYIDAGGRSMLFGPMDGQDYHAIGSKIIGAHELKGEYSFRCQGGESILRTADGKIVMAVHSRTNFLPGYFFFLQIHQMFFNEDGWPVINENEYYNDFNGKDEGLNKLSVSEIAGTYDAILTVRDNEEGRFTPFGSTDSFQVHITDATPTPSKDLTLNEDGTIGGNNYSGKWTLAEDGYSITINLDGIGIFKGYVLNAVDWARKNAKGSHRTITFTTLDSTKTGEYFWGNKR